MMSKSQVFLPEGDGVTHININPRGETELGKLLSHFPKTPFIHPYLGPFSSMEGFWYYIRSKEPDEKLRELAGHEAKFHGKKLEARRFDEFKDLIVDANYHKINQNTNIRQLLVESVLPFDHYYLFGTPGNQVQKRPVGFDFLIDGFTRIRELFKHGHQPLQIDYDSIFKRLREQP